MRRLAPTLAACTLAACTLAALAGCARLLPEPPAYAPPVRVAAAPETVTVGLADQGGAVTLRVGDRLEVLLPTTSGAWDEAPTAPTVPPPVPVLVRSAEPLMPPPGFDRIVFAAERAGSQTLVLHQEAADGAARVPFTLTVVVR